MRAPPASRIYQVAVSIFVAIALILQAGLVARAAMGKIGGPRFWPFINYAMYDDPHYEGETITAYYLIEGQRDDGTVVEISREALGMSIWHYVKMSRELKDGRPEAVALLRQMYEGPGELTEIRVKTLPYVVTRTGRAEKESVVVRRIPLPREPAAPRVAQDGSATDTR
jgi:hypothetical protein